MTATQTGAVGKTARSDRTEMMNLVGKSRAEQVNKELQESGATERVTHVPLDGVVESDDADHDGDDKGGGAGTAAAAGESAATSGEAETIFDFLDDDALSKTKIKVKVDGKVEDVLLSDVLKDTQKLRAADKRLEEAALIKKGAETEAAGIVAKAKEDADALIKAGKTAASEEITTETPSSDAIQKAVTGMYEGDPAQAAIDLTKAIGEEVTRRVAAEKATGTTEVDTTKIAQEVRTKMEWDQTIADFTSNHADIVDDPYLLGMWQGELNDAAKTATTPQAAVTAATEKVTAWLESKGIKKTAGDKVNDDEGGKGARQQARESAAAHSVTSTTSVSSKGGKEAPKPQTPTDTVAQMKAARGQT